MCNKTTLPAWNRKNVTSEELKKAYELLKKNFSGKEEKMVRSEEDKRVIRDKINSELKKNLGNNQYVSWRASCCMSPFRPTCFEIYIDRHEKSLGCLLTSMRTLRYVDLPKEEVAYLAYMRDAVKEMKESLTTAFEEKILSVAATINKRRKKNA